MFSKRIECIASKIPLESNLADVGCDHGYLIIEAYLNGKVNKAIAIDNKEGPLESAKSNISKYLDVRYSLSSGINDIDDDYFYWKARRALMELHNGRDIIGENFKDE